VSGRYSISILVTVLLLAGTACKAGIAATAPAEQQAQAQTGAQESPLTIADQTIDAAGDDKRLLKLMLTGAEAAAPTVLES
jgi:hypothetical protein